jgi:hypothetical protein
VHRICIGAGTICLGRCCHGRRVVGVNGGFQLILRSLSQPEAAPCHVLAEVDLLLNYMKPVSLVLGRVGEEEDYLDDTERRQLDWLQHHFCEEAKRWGSG